MSATTSTAAFEAFHKAQTEFKPAIKDSLNPHFKSKFADFASVYDAVSAALHSNGLFVTQPINVLASGTTVVETKIYYKDGVVICESQCPVTCKVQNDPQAMGSAITYARRYSLASIFCIVTDDDDAEAATARTTTQPAPVAQKAAPAAAPQPSMGVQAVNKLINTATNAVTINVALDHLMAIDTVTEEERTALKKRLADHAKSLKLTYDPTTKAFK